MPAPNPGFRSRSTWSAAFAARPLPLVVGLMLALLGTHARSSAIASEAPEEARGPRTAAFSGEYLVGTGQPPPFHTLTAAVTALNSDGVEGPVTLLLTDANYAPPLETLPIVINPIPGASAFSRVTIRPAPNVTSVISGSAPGAVIRLNGADFVTIDGAADGGTTPRLSIVNTSGAAATAAVWLSSSGPGAGCTDNSIRNCVLACGAAQNTSSAETFGVLLSGTAVAISSAGEGNDRNEIIGNQVSRCRWGIFLRGGVAPNQLNRIEANLVGPTSFGSDQIGRGGIVVQHQVSATIARNEVRYVGVRVGDVTPGIDRIGIGLGAFLWPGSGTTVTNSRVERNLVHHVVDEKTFSAVGLLVAGTGAPSANLIVNNMIHGVLANGTGGDQAIGIGISQGNGDVITFNSVALSGDLDPASTTTASWSAAGVRIGSVAPTNLTLRNNILDVDIESNNPALTHFAIVTPGSYSWGSGGADNNDYHAGASHPQSTLGGLGVTMPFAAVTTLPDWRGVFTPPQDLASQSVPPPFVGPSDLHLLPDDDSTLRGGGAPIPGVFDDYDGHPRDPGAPDVGADEVRLLSRAEAMQLVIDEVVTGHPDVGELVGFLYKRISPDSLLPSGTVVADFDSTFSHVVEEPAYFFWLDDRPSAIWSHATTFVFVGAGSGALTIHAGQAWPVVDTLEVDRFFIEGNGSPERFVGTYDMGVDIPFAHPVTSEGSTTSWAIIFLGEVREQREKDAHEKDLERAKQILNGAPRGPKISGSNIKSITGPNFCGASKKDFCDTLDAITGCDKLYIYYIGHGNASGNMGMRKPNGKSEKFTFKELAEKLKAKGIAEVCLVIDCCYSGKAIKELEKAGIKGTVVTAAGASQEGHWTPGAGWNLTVALQICMNDTLSDLNRDGEISLLEGLTWARGLNPALVNDGATGEILGDDKKTVIPAPVCTDLGQHSDGESNQICFQSKIHSYKVGDTSVSRRSLYVYNLSTVEAHRGVADKRIEVVCKDARGVATVRKLDQIKLAKKGDPAGKDRICLFDLDPSCVDIKLRLVNAAPGRQVEPASVPPFRDEMSLRHRTNAYARGEYLFHPFPVTGSAGDQFTVTVDPVPGWGLEVHPGTFGWSAGLDTAWVFVTGTIPPAAAQGAEFFATILNTTAQDTVDWTLQALVSDSLIAPIGAGAAFALQDLRSASGLDIATGHGSLLRSRLRVRGPSSCLVGPGGSLLLAESVVLPDSGVSYTFVAEGVLDFEGSCLIEPASGLRLLGASGVLSLGSVYGSHTDGLFLAGNLGALNVHQFLVESSVRDGVVFDATTNAVLRGVRILDSGRFDVLLQNGAEGRLVDSEFDDAAVSVATGSTLSRAWTTPFHFRIPAGPLPGVVVEVRDALGALVLVDTTDSRGYTDFHELLQFRQSGATRTDHTPHVVTAHWSGIDTTFSVTADSTRTIDVVWGAAASGIKPGEKPVRYLLGQNTPNPFRAATTIHFELPEDADVRLDVFDVTGRLVTTPLLGRKPAGVYDLRWEPGDLAPGVYWARLTAGSFVRTRKLVRLGGRP